jgi:predicted ATP-dependent endonuclease of OLD family
MRVRSLHIGNFKNLREFIVRFSDEKRSWVTVVLGWNGTGKSNLIESLVILFKELDLGKSPSFSYRIEYECSGSTVHIDAVSDDDPHVAPAIRDVKITVKNDSEEQAVTHKQFCSEKHANHRPGHVFGYYSGPSNRLEDHFNEHQNKFYRALLDGDERPLRRLFYARPVHANFVLLSFFSNPTEESRKFLSELLAACPDSCCVA